MTTKQLSVRAINTLATILEWPKGKKKLAIMAKDLLRDMLQKKVISQNQTIGSVLKRTPNCGKVTANEILRYIGVKEAYVIQKKGRYIPNEIEKTVIKTGKYLTTALKSKNVGIRPYRIAANLAAIEALVFTFDESVQAQIFRRVTALEQGLNNDVTIRFIEFTAPIVIHCKCGGALTIGKDENGVTRILHSHPRCLAFIALNSLFKQMSTPPVGDLQRVREKKTQHSTE